MKEDVASYLWHGRQSPRLANHHFPNSTRTRRPRKSDFSLIRSRRYLRSNILTYVLKPAHTNTLISMSPSYDVCVLVMLPADWNSFFYFFSLLLPSTSYLGSYWNKLSRPLAETKLDNWSCVKVTACFAVILLVTVIIPKILGKVVGTK